MIETGKKIQFIESNTKYLYFKNSCKNFDSNDDGLFYFYVRPFISLVYRFQEEIMNPIMNQIMVK